MATRVLLTVDTELPWRHYAAGAGWRENLALSYEAAGVGVPWQLGRLQRNGLKACFFVDPMPALLYGIEPVRAMVEPILASGQEVQLHLHTFWADLAEGRTANPRFDLTDFGPEEQLRLLSLARDLLVEAGAPSPTAFRSGCFAADSDTLAALKRLGIRYDSSHNGADHPRPSNLPLDPRLVDPTECGGVVEVPVSQIARPGGGLRPAQLCALSWAEMRSALRHADRENHPVVTIVSHSFEMASRDGRRVNQVVRGRFDRLCDFLACNARTMPTVTFAELPPPRLPARSQPLPANRLRTVRRLAEQAIGNTLYERPRVAAMLGL